VLLLLLAPLVLFPGLLKGGAIGAWDHLTVHHVAQEQAGGQVRHAALSDPSVQFQALREQVVEQVMGGHLPLWNPDLYAGAPLLGDAQSAPLSLMTWADALWPGLGALLVLWLTGLGTALLARRLGGAPLVAGLAAMTMPYTSVWLLHPHAASFAWLPWLLLALEARAAWAVVLASAAVLTGGHPETAAHALLIAGIWGLARQRYRAVLGLIPGVLLASPAWLPVFEQVQASATAAAHGGNRLMPAQLLDLVWPNFWGHPAGEGYRGPGAWADGVLHPGLAALGLALWSRHRALLAAWAVCIVVALVGLPLLNNARLGAEGALFVALAASMAPKGRGVWLAAGAVLLTGGWARWQDQGTLDGPVPMAAWTEELRELQGEGRVVGLGWALQPNTGSLAGLRDVRGYDLPVSRHTEMFMSHLDRRLQRPWFAIDAVDAQNRALLEFAAVRYVLAPEPQFGMELVELDAPLQVYALDVDAPRAWRTTGARAAASQRQAAQFVAAGHGARTSPPVEGLSEKWPLRGEVVPLSVEDHGDEVLMTLEGVEERSIVVLADAWAEGWSVSVDGSDAELLRVGGFFRGVVVQPGAREVRFLYRPAGWVWGLRLGLLGLLGLLAVIAMDLRGRGRAATPAPPRPEAPPTTPSD
jgi:hypothetical protein